MARPPVFKQEDLLSAAREVFVERGIRATTAEVAERAGVSEGTLFKRFGSKMGLLRAAAASAFSELERPPSFDTSAPLTRDAFGHLLTQLDAEFGRIVPIAAMALTHLTSVGEIPESLCGPNPKPLQRIRALAAFFETQVKQGHLRPGIDCEVLARTISGALWQNRFFRFVFDPEQTPPFPSKRYVRSLGDLLWPGIEPLAPSNLPTPAPTPARLSRTSLKRKLP